MSRLASIEKIFTGPVGYAVVILVGAGVLIYFGKKAKETGQEVGSAVKNMLTGKTNFLGDSMVGTPYYGQLGVVGSYGSTVNEVFGGAPQSLGEWLGGKASDFMDLINPAFDPKAATADHNSPPPSSSTIATSPVSWSPVVLPYSYKQATIDTPALLGADEIFTPSYDASSGGTYMESGSSVGIGPSTPGYYGLA